nr:nitroreductase family protein [uncultured Tolumonas sp.]
MELVENKSFKATIKKNIQAVPFVWNMYWGTKQQLLRIAILLRGYGYDIRCTYKSMFWAPQQYDIRSLCAELIFQFHKLEKGLVMPGEPRLFGLDPANATMNILEKHGDAILSADVYLFRAAMATLIAYRDKLVDYKLDAKDQITSRLQRFLAARQVAITPELTTPHSLPALLAQTDASVMFDNLAKARRSVRAYKPDVVPQDILRKAIAMAQLSPSACNRQPSKVYLISDAEKKAQFLNLQNGNRGFGHLAPHIAVLTTDERCYFNAMERHEPYIDSGMFAMSFILALRTFDVGTCCLNWCVTSKTDIQAHKMLNIADSERISMVILLGFIPDDCQVPRSVRRDIDNVLIDLG